MGLSPEIIKLIDAAEQAMVPAELKAKGWVYKDIPGRLNYEAWDLLLSIFGEGNFEIVAMTHAPDYKRGQFFLSPQALKNMQEYADKKRVQKDAAVID